jgi:hypothetical protein
VADGGLLHQAVEHLQQGYHRRCHTMRLVNNEGGEQIAVGQHTVSDPCTSNAPFMHMDIQLEAERILEAANISTVDLELGPYVTPVPCMEIQTGATSESLESRTNSRCPPHGTQSTCSSTLPVTESIHSRTIAPTVRSHCGDAAGFCFDPCCCLFTFIAPLVCSLVFG